MKNKERGQSVQKEVSLHLRHLLTTWDVSGRIVWDLYSNSLLNREDLSETLCPFSSSSKSVSPSFVVQMLVLLFVFPACLLMSSQTYLSLSISASFLDEDNCHCSIYSGNPLCLTQKYLERMSQREECTWTTDHETSSRPLSHVLTRFDHQMETAK